MTIQSMNLSLLIKRDSEDNKTLPSMFNESCIEEVAKYLGASIEHGLGKGTVEHIAVCKTLFSGFESSLSESGQARLELLGNTPSGVTVLNDEDVCVSVESGVNNMSDFGGNRYDLVTLPVFLKMSGDDNFYNGDHVIALHPKTRDVINQVFDGYECVYLGLGTNERLKELFLCDYDVLFAIKELIQESEAHVWKSYEFAFIKGPKNMTFVPYVTLSDFQRLWKSEGDDVMSHQSIYIRNLRAGLDVMELLGRPFKVIKVPVETLEEMPTEDDIKHFEKMKEEKGLVKDFLLGAPRKALGASNVSINNYDSGDIGMVASIVSFYDGSTPTTRVAHYPIHHNDEELIGELQKEIEATHPDKRIEVKYIDVTEFRDQNRLLAHLER